MIYSYLGTSYESLEIDVMHYFVSFLLLYLSWNMISVDSVHYGGMCSFVKTAAAAFNCQGVNNYNDNITW